jgi:hypothetical protein
MNLTIALTLEYLFWEHDYVVYLESRNIDISEHEYVYKKYNINVVSYLRHFVVPYIICQYY